MTSDATLEARRTSRRTQWQQISRHRKKVGRAPFYETATHTPPLPPPPASELAACPAHADLPPARWQAEIAALEEHVSALHRQLEQTQLDNVNKKAQIATLARLTNAAAAPALAYSSDEAATQDPSRAINASQPEREPWQVSVSSSPEVRPLTCTPCRCCTHRGLHLRLWWAGDLPPPHRLRSCLRAPFCLCRRTDRARPHFAYRYCDEHAL